MIEIWAPKYSTNSVLIGTHKVVDGINQIYFTRAKHLEGGVYEVDSATIRMSPKQPNGAGYVYVVPFDKLKCVKQPS